MDTLIFIIKEYARYVEFIVDMSHTTTNHIARHGKKVKALKSAQHTSHGYKISPKKNIHDTLLIAIVNELAQKHAHLTPAYISEFLFRALNTRVIDAIREYNSNIDYKHATAEEKKYHNSLLIDVFHLPTYIPRHPWIYPTKVVDESKWMAKDLITNQELLIAKKKKGKHIFYELSFSSARI